MKTLDWNSLDEDARAAALSRPERRDDAQLQARVRTIVDDVRTGGWEALCATAKLLDGEEPRQVEVEPIAAAARRDLSADQVEAIELAARNIRLFQQASQPLEICVEPVPGLVVHKLWRPIDRVGIYVPGGKTPLFSTLLMLAIPAQVAGVREILAVTPPRPQGGLDPVIALAASLCGLDKMWTVGGAQAIAALAFGAGPIPKVDKICGPGNAWVAEAKRLVSSMPRGPAIDLPAGPSELMVIADDSADVVLVAADLLSQAEHDPDAQVMLVTPSVSIATKIATEVERQLGGLPRAAIARESLAEARTIIAGDVDQAAEVANLYAPEHLSLATRDADQLVPRIRNAGAIFVGAGAAETFGDYLTGSSHVLPTDGAARVYGGVSVHTFLKSMSVQSATPEAVRSIAGPAAILARLESLEAHARAADARLECVR